MGMQNSKGNYVKITNVDVQQSRVYTEKWKDKATRDNPTEFDHSIPDSVQCMSLGDKLKNASENATILDDIFTAGYEALKMEPNYNNAGDEQWVDL